MKTILVVDDDPLVRWTVRERLQPPRYAVVDATTAEEARRAFARGVDAVVVHARLPDGDARDLIVEFHRLRPGIPIVLMSSHVPRGGSTVTGARRLVFVAAKPLAPHELEGFLEQGLGADPQPPPA